VAFDIPSWAVLKKSSKVHYFHYRDGELYAEEVPLRELAASYGTPLYVYSQRTILRHIRAYQEAFRGHQSLICYALKANSNQAILRLMASQALGADVVSGGELYRALRAGIPAKRIVFAGVGKGPEELRMALRKRLLMLNVESAEELEEINRLAGSLGLRAPVALRVNPDIDPLSHPYISTGLRRHKFGIPMEEALEHYRRAMHMEHVEVLGVHKHIGSQLTDVGPFVEALGKVLALVRHLRAEGLALRYLDMGGGLGIPYKEGEQPHHPKELARRVKPLLRNQGLVLIVEPGRSIVGNAGLLLTRCLYTKQGGGKRFLIVDAAMNDLLRPALYGAYHQVLPVRRHRGKRVPTDVVGPICESGDFLAKDRPLPLIKRGELLAVMSAGAYGFSMSSNYNSRLRAAEVLVDGTAHRLIRKRETYRDLLRGEL